MRAFLLGFFRMVWLFGKDQRGVVLENLALRQQLSIYKRKSYFIYFHRSRTHLALDKDAPDRRVITPKGEIVAIPEVGGLHHRL